MYYKCNIWSIILKKAYFLISKETEFDITCSTHGRDEKFIKKLRQKPPPPKKDVLVVGSMII
jgi:hypothetical protein